MKYRVIAHRTTEYEVEDADDSQHAIDEMIEGNAKEVGGTTHQIVAVPLCPTCGEPLTNRTTRSIKIDVDVILGIGGEELLEPSYCDRCDREVVPESSV